MSTAGSTSVYASQNPARDGEPASLKLKTEHLTIARCRELVRP